MRNYSSKFKIILRFALSFCVLIFAFCILVNGAGAVGATLFLAPSIGSFSVGSTFDVAVKVNTGGTAINTAEATLTFDPTALEVKNISKTNSIFSLWVQDPTFSNTDGVINFAGGKPSPGHTGSSGKLITITFKALTTGAANVNFSSASVLADDGKGTNILSSLIPGAYTITTKEISVPAPSVPDTPSPTPEGVPAPPVVFSSTHPEEDKWYSNNAPEFSWKLPSDVTAVSLLLHQKPTGDPGPYSDGLIESTSFEDVKDGIWYFHIKFRNENGWGEITHRNVLIDTIPPNPFQVVFDNKGDATNPIPILFFKTEDTPSGIEYYQVIIDDIEMSRTTPQYIKDNPYNPSPISPGVQLVMVKAFDRAGNFTLTSTEIEIEPISAPIITKIPISIQTSEPLEIEGESLPEFTVRIYLQQGGGEPFFEEVQPDSEGKFKLTYEKALAKGDYLVWALAEDERGALSNSTKKYSLEVGLPPILKIGKIAIDYLTVMITLIILLVGAGVVIFYGWYRISVWRKRVKRETGEVGESVRKAFRALVNELEEQIEYLDGKPGLTKSERKVRDKLKEALSISEEFISKELKDVEKELE